MRPAHVFGAVVSLLRERSVCVVAADSATAAAVAFGLANLLEPLAWQGALITTLPGDEVDLLGSPVPSQVRLRLAGRLPSLVPPPAVG